MRIKAIAFALGLGLLAAPANANKTTWNGCGVGGNMGFTSGLIDSGGPIGIGSNGPALGVIAFCDARVNNLVVGAEASYDWFYGNLSDIGLKTDLTLGGRAGVLLNSETLLYGHLGWSQIDTDFGKYNGYKFGPGIELKLPNTPIYLDARYSYASYDVSVPGVNAETHTFRFGAKLKFGPGGFSSPFEDWKDSSSSDPVSKGCDPKMGKCR